VIGESRSPIWRKSPASGTSGCVEIAFVGDDVLVRDSKDVEGPHLKFSQAEWSVFIEAVRAGAFSIPHARPDDESAEISKRAQENA
jgi:hypothetical protein